MKYISIRKKLLTHILLIGLFTFLFALVISYLIFVPMLTEKAEINAERTNEEIMSLIDTTVSFVESSTENLAVAVSQNEEIETYFTNPTEQNRNIAMIMLSNLISRDGLIRSVMIEPHEKPILESMNKTKTEDYVIVSSPWYDNLHSLPYSRGFSAVYPVEISNTIYSSTAYVSNFYQNNRWTSFVVFVSLNSMINNIKTSARDNLDGLALLDSEGNTFYTYNNDASQSSHMTDLINSQMLNGKDEAKGSIAFKKTSISNKFSLVSFVSMSTILKSLIPYFTGIVIVLLTVLVLTLTAISRSLRSFTGPISILSRNMQIAAKGNLECTVQIEREDEIGTLGKSFNKMLADLKSSLNLIALQEEQKQQTKFSLLVSQIDPHFIYNTINSINYLARKERCDDIIVVNSALISILRDRLRVNDIQITDSVEHEVYVTEQYIMIQKYMFDWGVQINWDVEQSLLSAQIPKNLVQPLIENALFHGLVDEENGGLYGRIDVRIWDAEDSIKISVIDNGAGMDEETLNLVQNEIFTEEDRGKRIGISNIRGRLYYLYGERNCISIKSGVGQGTTITLTLYCK